MDSSQQTPAHLTGQKHLKTRANRRVFYLIHIPLQPHRRLQRQLSGMDNTDKLLAATKRTRDTVETGAAQLRTALRVQLAGAGGPGARRPT